jgi:hypothetical protein
MLAGGLRRPLDLKTSSATLDRAPTKRRSGIIALLAISATSLAAVAMAGQKATEALPTNEIPSFSLPDLGHALLCLVSAASLGALLAFRPRRAGGPPRVANVIQAQIMMAIVGALVMLVVGSSLPRAFAIAGTAGLVRYRAKLDDPKDASVMLSCLAVGLASGVGLLYLAVAGAVFIVGVLWLLEWREPWPAKFFDLKVSAADSGALKSEVEALLARHHVKFELRGSTEKDMTYSVEMKQGRRTDRISEEIAALHGAVAVDVAWTEKKAGK